MTTRPQSVFLLRNLNARRERMLRKMASARAAKERKRMQTPVELEPKLDRYHPLEIGLRDTRTGETGWVPLVSIRDAVKRLRVVSAYYLDGRL